MFCKECQYNLHALPESRCPECGRAFRKNDPTTFDTHVPGPVAKAKRKYGRHINAAIIISLSVLVLQTAIRIEVGNVRAGGFLPRKDLSTMPLGANPKWRWIPFDTPARWLEWYGPKDAKGQPVNRALTAAEQQRMQTDIRLFRHRNHLRWLVSTWGVLQYPCVFVLLPASLRFYVTGKTRRGKTLGTGGTIVAVACAILMLYRGYFSSLGS